MKRYEKFADEIAGLIRNGVLGPGPERVKTLSYLASVNQALLAESISQVFAPTGTGNAPERL